MPTPNAIQAGNMAATIDVSNNPLGYHRPQTETAQTFTLSGAQTVSDTMLSYFGGVNGQNPSAYLVQLQTKGPTMIMIGESPSVTTSTGTRLDAGTTIMYRLLPADKIAMIAETSTGKFNITEMR